MEDFLCMSRYLSCDADITHNKPFDTVFQRKHSKLLKGNSDELVVAIDDSDDDMTSYVQQAMKKHCKIMTSQTSYVDCRFLVATSNTVECLFSSSRSIMTYQRSKMSPIMSEAILFLKTNHSFWNLKTVASAMKNNDDPTNPVEPVTLDRDPDEFYE
jgi:hypothetical protein